MDLEKIKADLEAKSGLSRDVLWAKVRQKMEKFSGLLNEESAWLMVGREFGIEPAIPKNYSPIGSLVANTFGVAIKARVRQLFAPKSFERNGRLGQNMNLVIADDTGQIRLTLWNDQVDEARQKGIQNGSGLEIDFANVTEYNGQIQLQLAKNTPWRILPVEPTPTPWTPLDQVRVDATANIRATVIGVFPIKDFQTRDGRTGYRASALVFADTTTKRIVAWGEHALAIQAFDVGDEIEIHNALVKKGLQGDLEIQLNNQSGIARAHSKNDGPWFDAIAKDHEHAPLNSQPSGLVRIEGTIESVSDRSGVYLVCPRCAGKLDKGAVDHRCARCGNVEKPRKKAVVGIEIADSTGRSNARFFGRQAEKLVGLSSDEIENGIDEEKKQALIGQTIEIIGNARENAFSSENEIIAKAWRKKPQP